MSKYIRYIFLPIVLVLLIFTATCLVSTDSIPKVSSGLPWDKVVHFVMFFALSFVNFIDYYRLRDGNPPMIKWILWGFIVPVIYGGIIEILQERYFGRSGELLDFVADAAGSALAMVIILFLHRIFSNK